MRQPSLPVSATCLWYRHGDLDSDPLPAIVFRSSSEGRLDLVVFEFRNLLPKNVKAVRHRDDLMATRQKDATYQGGLWDYGETWTEWQGETGSAKQRAEDAWNEEKIEANLMSLYDQKGDGSAVEIATEMAQLTGVIWNHQQVNARIRVVLARRKREAEALLKEDAAETAVN